MTKLNLCFLGQIPELFAELLVTMTILVIYRSFVSCQSLTLDYKIISLILL